MIIKRKIYSALALPLMAASISFPVVAQNSSSGNESTLEEVTVTGSRIRTRDGMETPTPVTSLGMEEIAQLDPGSLIDAVSQMPQFLNNASPETAGSVSGPLGAANVNLRGIGSNRTLVLLDGRRVPSFNRLGTADINTFPDSMIRNIEIVTGGASAAYGSDAVSGTVNFFLDTDYTGLKTHFQKGVTDRADGKTTEFSISGGADLGPSTHFIASAEMYKAESVSGYNDRNWFDNWGTMSVNGVPTIARDVHSRDNTAGGLIRAPAVLDDDDNVILPTSALDWIHFVGDSTPVQFQDGSVVGTNNQVGGTNFLGSYGSAREINGELSPKTERSNAFLYIDHEFSDNFTGYFQYMYGSNKVNLQVDSGIMYGGLGAATIYDDNAFLPESIRAVMVAEGRESFSFNRKASTFENDTGRIQDNELNSFTLGFKSEVNGIFFQGYVQHAVSDSLFTAKNYTRTDRMYRALDAVLDPATGAIVCNSTLTNPNDGCVPANFFGTSSLSAAALDYIRGTMWRKSEVEQNFAEFSLDTDLFEGWAGPISIAAGVSYRDDSLLQYAGPDSLVAQNTNSAASEGYRGLPGRFSNTENILQFAIGGEDRVIEGSFDVVEVFAETLVPLVRDLPGIQALDLSIGVRQADYEGSGNVLAYKGGLDWRVNEDFRVRLTNSRDTRAASLSERFDSQGAGLTVRDPYNGDIQYTASQNIGGNPEVEPELGDTWTAGIVITPTALEGFSFSVDYYDVQISDAIAQFGAQNIVNDCFNSGGTSTLCSQIEFDAGVTGSESTPRVLRVSDIFLNLDEARVTGYDIETAYSTPVSWFADGGEDLSLRLFASVLKENSQTPKGSTATDNAGETLFPELTMTAMLNYRVESFSTGLTFRYIDERVLENNPRPSADFADPSVDSIFMTNLRFGYDFEAGTSGSGQLFFNIANLFDEDPPIIPSYSGFFGTQYVNPGLHDVLGRRFTAGVEFEF